MKRSHWLWIVLVVGAVAYLATRGGGPEEQIREQLAEVEALLEKSSGESSLAAVDRANQLGQLLTEEFTIAVEPYGERLTTRQDLARGFVGFRRAYETIAVGLVLQEVQVTGQGAESAVRATFLGTGGGDGPSRQAWDVAIRWRDDGGWKMEEVRVVGEAEGIF